MKLVTFAFDSAFEKVIIKITCCHRVKSIYLTYEV